MRHCMASYFAQIVDTGQRAPYDLILSLGATVFGTFKLAFWVPYTYDQQNTNGRETIDVKYRWSLLLAFSRWDKYMLKVMA